VLAGLLLSTRTFLMCGTRSWAIETSTAGLSSMRFTGVAGAGSISTVSFQMRLQGLPLEAIEPHGAGIEIGRERRVEPCQYAAAAFGRRPARDRRRRRRASASSAVEPNAQARADPDRADQMVDAGMARAARPPWPWAPCGC